MMSARSIWFPQAHVRIGLAAFAGLLIALVAFSGALTDLAVRWTRQEEYSHGFLIPIVAAWLL